MEWRLHYMMTYQTERIITTLSIKQKALSGQPIMACQPGRIAIPLSTSRAPNTLPLLHLRSWRQTTGCQISITQRKSHIGQSVACDKWSAPPQASQLITSSKNLLFYKIHLQIWEQHPPFLLAKNGLPYFFHKIRAQNALGQLTICQQLSKQSFLCRT